MLLFFTARPDNPTQIRDYYVRVLDICSVLLGITRYFARYCYVLLGICSVLLGITRYLIGIEPDRGETASSQEEVLGICSVLNQIAEKLRRLKKKYRNAVAKMGSGRGFVFKSPHDRATVTALKVTETSKKKSIKQLTAIEKEIRSRRNPIKRLKITPFSVGSFLKLPEGQPDSLK